MALPSTRELELETLLRLRDTQLAELTDELTHLRQSLVSQPGPSTSDPVTLPPALVSVLLPHLHTTPTASSATTGSNTVNAALTQRARLLQEENDELYDLLKQGETGKLKEEVRGLRRVVASLESALRESHQVISSLSTEINKAYETLASSARPSNSTNNTSKSYSNSPRTSYHAPLPPTETGNGPTKLPPTGPRAYKKPRLSESQGSPPLRNHTSLPPHKAYGHSHSSARGTDTREYPPRRSTDGRGKPNHHKMDVDDDQRARPASPLQERERDRDRDRGGGRERDRERDGHRSHRRNGNFGGGGGGRGGRRHDHWTVSPKSLRIQEFLVALVVDLCCSISVVYSYIPLVASR
ncbi:putative WTAP/Mum2p family protein [Lyophyllum shimeji]|uniref:WTAP/Mum2p family protein n=1 Tax=Lyophyllum shimeji TaxID=47721 RepID=A0A9P3PE57_LYOSH|nr:putative WTAP/Mum2p family protein [Lyophyllum shimeji]